MLPRLLQAEARQGDPLGAVVEEEGKEEMGRAGETAQRDSQPANPVARAEKAAGEIERPKRAMMIALAALALAAAVVVYFTRFAPGGRAIRSVVVLPFSNESGDPNKEDPQIPAKGSIRRSPCPGPLGEVDANKHGPRMTRKKTDGHGSDPR